MRNQLQNKPAIQEMIEFNIELRGKKVLLRRFSSFDITSTYIGWLNDPEVVQFSNQRFITHDRESCMNYLDSFAGTGNMLFSVYSLKYERNIGTMTAYVSVHHGTVDVGLMIGDKAVWGEGVGLDAWTTLINWLLGCKGVRKVTAGTVGCNYGMIKVMERSGMHQEATRRSQEIINRQEVNVNYYAKFPTT
jgi:ribosomal-protein-alanine N-acetyltransferase